MNLYHPIIRDKEKVGLDDIILASTTITLCGLIKDYKFVDELNKYGLLVSNKILLYGY